DLVGGAARGAVVLEGLALRAEVRGRTEPQNTEAAEHLAGHRHAAPGALWTGPRHGRGIDWAEVDHDSAVLLAFAQQQRLLDHLAARAHETELVAPRVELDRLDRELVEPLLALDVHLHVRRIAPLSVDRSEHQRRDARPQLLQHLGTLGRNDARALEVARAGLQRLFGLQELALPAQILAARVQLDALGRLGGRRHLGARAGSGQQKQGSER